MTEANDHKTTVPIIEEMATVSKRTVESSRVRVRTVIEESTHDKAGKQADQAAGVKPSVLSEGPQQRLGKLQDRAEDAQARATEAQADALKDQAKTVRASADSQGDALDHQAVEVRAQAKSTSNALDNQADAIRHK